MQWYSPEGALQCGMVHSEDWESSVIMRVWAPGQGMKESPAGDGKGSRW